MDRSTKATLSTYNTWITLSRLQRNYQPKTCHCFRGRVFNHINLCIAIKPRPKLCHITLGCQKPCLVSMDSDLEAFSRIPADGGIAALALQLAAFTKGLIEVFLSY